MDQGEERIEDEALLTKLRRQARGIMLKSLLGAGALTLLLALVP